MVTDQHLHGVTNSDIATVELGDLSSSGIESAMNALVEDHRFKVGPKIGLAFPSTLFYMIPSFNVEASESEASELKFELEQHLPVDAEDMAVVGYHQSAIVLDSTLVAQLVEAIDRLFDARVELVVPTKLALALCLANDDEHAVRINDLDSVDLVNVKEAEFHWEYYPGSEVLSASGDPAARRVGLGKLIDLRNSNNAEEQMATKTGVTALLDLLSEPNRLKLEQVNFAEQVNQAAGLVAEKVPILNLLLLGLSFAIILLAAGIWMRADRLREAAYRNNEAVRAEYRRLFPGQRIKGPVTERLIDSKVKRAQQVNSMIQIVNRTANLLRVFNSVMEALPQSTDFQMSSINVRAGRLELEGVCESIESVKRLRSALKRKFVISESSNFAKDFLLVLSPKELGEDSP